MPAKDCNGGGLSVSSSISQPAISAGPCSAAVTSSNKLSCILHAAPLSLQAIMCPTPAAQFCRTPSLHSLRSAPQHTADPSNSRAQAWLLPLDIDLIVLPPGTTAGVPGIPALVPQLRVWGSASISELADAALLAVFKSATAQRSAKPPPGAASPNDRTKHPSAQCPWMPLTPAVCGAISLQGTCVGFA